MSARWRTAMLLVALAVLAVGWAHVAGALPPFGAPASRYGVTVNALLPGLRHVSNMVAAVNFDVRGIDTLGEECMLIAAVVGAVVLLRGSRGEQVGDRALRVPGRPLRERSDAVSFAARVAGPLLLMFGLYVALHGLTTPGGGFQGGVIVGSALLLVYLGEGYPAWRRLVRGPALAAAEGLGALAFVGAAGVPLALGRPALAADVLPLGTFEDLYAGGLMVVVNLAVGLAVAGSFGLLLLEFMEETRAPETGADDGEDAAQEGGG